MPRHRVLREKQNLTEDKIKTTDNKARVFKRTNISGHGISQQKRKHDEVEPEPKIPVPSKTLARYTEKPIALQGLDAAADKTEPTITFNGPREAFNVKTDDLNILEVVLGKVEKIPVTKNTAEDVRENREIHTAIQILNEQIKEVEISDNPQEDKVVASKTVVKVANTLNSNNEVEIVPTRPVAVQNLNSAIEDIESSSRNSQSSDQFYMTQWEYHKDIFKHLIELEAKLIKPKAGYMDKQPELTSSMRSKLVDWLVQVFKGINEKVLHMTVHFIDTFLSRMSVVRTKLQLLACAAGMIACKSEEVCIQTTEYWIMLGGKTFTKSQLLKMERMILSVMKFELTRPTIVCFIRHICYVEQVKAKEAMLANYIAELVLVEGDEYLRYAPSLLASAAIALARHTLGEDKIWTEELESATDYMIQQLLPAIGLLRKLLETAVSPRFNHVFNKYMREDRNAVATVSALKLKDFNPKDIILEHNLNIIATKQ